MTAKTKLSGINFFEKLYKQILYNKMRNYF